MPNNLPSSRSYNLTPDDLLPSELLGEIQDQLIELGSFWVRVLPHPHRGVGVVTDMVGNTPNPGGDARPAWTSADGGLWIFALPTFSGWQLNQIDIEACGDGVADLIGANVTYIIPPAATQGVGVGPVNNIPAAWQRIVVGSPGTFPAELPSPVLTNESRIFGIFDPNAAGLSIAAWWLQFIRTP